MKLGIEGGCMEITDDNRTIVSSDIAQEIKDKYEKPDDKKDSKQPELTIKD